MPDAWIAPDGRIYYVEIFGHYSFASKFLGAEDRIGNAVEILENRGWLHVSYGMVHHAHPITNSQTDALFQLVEKCESDSARMHFMRNLTDLVENQNSSVYA